MSLLIILILLSKGQTTVVFDSSRVRKQKQRNKAKKVRIERFKTFSREDSNP